MGRTATALALLLALLFLAGCGSSPADRLPDPDATAETSEARLPSVAGVWRGTETYGDVTILLRQDGTGALLRLCEPDGEAFSEPFYLGLGIRWALADHLIDIRTIPEELPNGSFYVPPPAVGKKLVTLYNGILALADEKGTEYYRRVAEPEWITVADYARILADAVIGPDAENAEALYDAFYRAFAAKGGASS